MFLLVAHVSFLVSFGPTVEGDEGHFLTPRDIVKGNGEGFFDSAFSADFFADVCSFFLRRVSSSLFSSFPAALDLTLKPTRLSLGRWGLHFVVLPAAFFLFPSSVMCDSSFCLPFCSSPPLASVFLVSLSVFNSSPIALKEFSALGPARSTWKA